MPDPVRSLQGRKAVMMRDYGPKHKKTLEAGLELRFARFIRDAETVLNQHPAFTQTQFDAIVALIGDARARMGRDNATALKASSTAALLNGDAPAVNEPTAAENIGAEVS